MMTRSLSIECVRALHATPLAALCLPASASAWAVRDVRDVRDVVVSQGYGGGGNSVATWRNDFIERENCGAATVDLTG